MALTQLGRLADGERLFRDVWAGRRRALGAEHPETLIAMSDLANSLMNQKRYQEAEGLYDEALQMQRRIYKPDHPHIILTLTGLGWAYMEEHRFALADRTFHEALSLSRRTLGENHSYTYMAVYNLACLAALQGKREEAFAALREAVDHGYGNAQQMAGDTDLQSLHIDPRFNALMMEIQTRAPH